MTGVKHMKELAVILFVGLSLVACGDSNFFSRTGGAPSFSGDTNPATVSNDNSQKLAIAATEGSKQGVKQGSSGGSPFKAALTANSINDLAIEITQNALSVADGIGNLPSGVTETIDGDCGGSFSFNGEADISSGTITFNDYCTASAGDTVIINGVVDFTIEDSGAFTFIYRNVTITTGGETFTLNATIRCNSSGTSCTFESDFTGDNGTVYRTSDISISGNNTTGYNIQGSVSDPNVGMITFNASGITICENGNIGSGRIDITDSTGNIVISVTFPDCDTMTITFAGVTKTIPQP